LNLKTPGRASALLLPLLLAFSDPSQAAQSASGPLDGFLASVKRTTLPNGLTLLVREQPGTGVVAINTWVKAGYFNEPDEVAGMAHLFEHMFFKGSKKFPGAEQISQELAAVGGDTNAGTIYDSTNYFFVVPTEGFGRALEIMADAIANPLFDAGELERESEVVIEESNRKLDNPPALSLERMIATSFTQHRIKRWRIGSNEVLRNIERENLLQFFRTLYLPQNMILSIAGDVRAADVEKAVAATFGTLATAGFDKRRGPAEPAQTEFRYGSSTGDLKQGYSVFGWHTQGVGGDAELALDLASQILGSGRSSRFFRHVVGPDAAATANVFHYQFDDVGLMIAQASFDEARRAEVDRRLLGEIERLKIHGPTAYELQPRIRSSRRASRAREPSARPRRSPTPRRATAISRSARGSSRRVTADRYATQRASGRQAHALPRSRGARETTPRPRSPPCAASFRAAGEATGCRRRRRRSRRADRPAERRARQRRDPSRPSGRARPRCRSASIFRAAGDGVSGRRRDHATRRRALRRGTAAAARRSTARSSSSAPPRDRRARRRVRPRLDVLASDLRPAVGSLPTCSSAGVSVRAWSRSGAPARGDPAQLRFVIRAPDRARAARSPHASVRTSGNGFRGLGGPDRSPRLAACWRPPGGRGRVLRRGRRRLGGRGAGARRGAFAGLPRRAPPAPWYAPAPSSRLRPWSSGTGSGRRRHVVRRAAPAPERLGSKLLRRLPPASPARSSPSCAASVSLTPSSPPTSSVVRAGSASPIATGQKEGGGGEGRAPRRSFAASRPTVSAKPSFARGKTPPDRRISSRRTAGCSALQPDRLHRPGLDATEKRLAAVRADPRAPRHGRCSRTKLRDRDPAQQAEIELNRARTATAARARDRSQPAAA
jgi:predicted Zn-dependent peptidase